MPRLSPALLAAIAAASVIAGCSDRSQEATANAADSIAADANATGRKAVSDVDAATDRAVNAAQNTIDGARPAVDNAADNVGKAARRTQHNAGKMLKDAGNAMQ